MKVENGTIEVIYNNQKQNPLFQKPVLQIIFLQKIGNNSGEKFRYRASLSDGTAYMKAIFASELTKLFDADAIDKYSLIKLGQWCIRTLKESYYIYVQQIAEYEKCNVEIGSAVNYETGKASLKDSNKSKISATDETTKKHKTIENMKQETTKPVFESVVKNENILKDIDSKEKRKNDIDASLINHINTINPFQNKWMIRGRVVLKSDIKKYANKRGEGKFFSFEIADETGQIKVVAFNDVVDLFFYLIEVGRIYVIQKGQIKMSNKKFSNNNNDYDIHLDINSEIEKVEESETPKFFFKFHKIKDIELSDKPIDVIGIVKETSSAVSFVVKSTQKESTRRDLILLDETGIIEVTLWGSKAEIDIEVDNVLAIQCIKVSDYNGLSLSSTNVSQVYKNPDIIESHNLLGWYNEKGKDIKIDVPQRKVKLSTIEDIKDKETAFLSIRATLMFIKEDTMIYDSCIQENCTKKVYKNDFGEYRCEKCDKTSYECNSRFLIYANVSDYTGQLWTTIFNDQAVSLLGTSAHKLRDLVVNDFGESQTIIRRPLHKDFIFKLKSTQQNYNDEVRMRYNICDVKKVNYKEETRNNMLEIEKLMNKCN